MASKKEILRQNLLDNHKKQLIHFFDKYRGFNVQNEKSRPTFFSILKQQILNSLSVYEKIDLLQEIQCDLYSNSNPDQFYQESQLPNVTTFSNGPDGHYSVSNGYEAATFPAVHPGPDYYTSQVHGYGEPAANNGFRYSSHVISRSSRVNGSDEVGQLKFEDLSISSNGQEEDEENTTIIEEAFRKLILLISKGEEVTEELNRIAKDHGTDILRRIITYSPNKRVSLLYNGEPIMFLLVLQLDKYETALDRLVEDDLLDLSQRNQYNMSIFNVLISKGFAGFLNFLAYLNRKNIDSTIQYVCLKNDYMVQLRDMGNDCEPVLNSNTSEMGMKAGDEFMIDKGILYCRQLIAQSNPKIVKELVSHSYLYIVLHHKVENGQQPYIKVLAETYPTSKPEVDHIIKGDYESIVQSPFVLWVGQRSLDNLYVFLRSLIKDFQVDRADIRRALLNENVDGETIQTLIQSRDYQNRFPISARRIDEFIQHPNKKP